MILFPSSYTSIELTLWYWCGLLGNESTAIFVLKLRLESWLGRGKVMMLLLLMHIYNDFQYPGILEFVWLIHKWRNIWHEPVYNPSPTPMIRSKNLTNHLPDIYFLLFEANWSDFLLGSESSHYRVATLINATKDQRAIQLNKPNITYHVHPKWSIRVFFFPLESFHVDFLIL